jgi:hypothetical protein
MKMRDSIPSISTGSIASIFATSSGTGIFEAILVAFIGGAVGYLAKLLTEAIVKKLKKLFKK